MCYDRFYEMDDYPPYECTECDKKMKRMEHAAEFLESIVKQLYTREPLDSVKLDSHLEELCSYLDVKFEYPELEIERKKPIWLKTWMDDSVSHMQQLRKQAI